MMKSLYGLIQLEKLLAYCENVSLKNEYRALRNGLDRGVPRSFPPEDEYKRCGALTYVAVLDVHRAKVFGGCERKNGIAPFNRLVADVMSQSPYDKARRVFWIVDNGSSHRGDRAVERLQSRYSNLVLVHAPVHASWLNQVEIYFSILQRKVLTPNEFSSLQELQERLLCFQDHYEQIAAPFEWKFTRDDLNILLTKIKTALVTFKKQAA